MCVFDTPGLDIVFSSDCLCGLGLALLPRDAMAIGCELPIRMPIRIMHMGLSGVRSELEPFEALFPAVTCCELGVITFGGDHNVRVFVGICHFEKCLCWVSPAG